MISPGVSDLSIPDLDVESEDEDDEDDTSSRSASYVGPSRMTHRQAALKGMVEATELVSLGK